MTSDSFHRVARCFAVAALFACFGISATANAQKKRESSMSGMGAIAHRRVMKLVHQAQISNPSLKRYTSSDDEGTGDIGGEDNGDVTASDGDPQDDDTPNIAGGQAETSLACDSTGQHIVVGFNDTRGFNFAQTDVSGFMYSDNGGVTWIDGGQLPVNVGSNTTIGAAIYPEPFGDPEIVYLGGSNFAYFSILLKARTATATAQTMCVHLSNDYGHTWK